jgi:phosphoenolpyruvate carboxykinase (ATP)
MQDANNIPNLSYLGIQTSKAVHYQKSIAELVETAIHRQEGVLSDTGALAADTGKFTGRSPKDRFIVEDSITKDAVWWGSINQGISPTNFDHLYQQVCTYLNGKDLFVRDAIAGATPKHQIRLRAITESAYQSIFVNNMFIRLSNEETSSTPEWTILAATGYTCPDPSSFGIKNPNFVIINFTKKIILIAGTGYTGEIKKGIFTVLNFILPHDKKVLSMHCSANTDERQDSALYFGLSGTGKTTLSADRERKLIGDDEHGWDDEGIFNFEGGCYAKCVGLDPEKEPEIFQAVKFGALLENINFHPGTRIPDFDNIQKTENTRVAYPIHHIENIAEGSVGGAPKNIFFLTADAFGVLPPVSKLSVTQAMYHFISGYTAKVAGTEVGVTEPKAVFSACFGEAFLPLHPSKYAELLREKLQQGEINVWLINTGWVAGPYGVGRRIKLAYTRSIIKAALRGNLNDVSYQTHPIFGLKYPTSCPNIPDAVLDPIAMWDNEEAYYAQANQLAQLFIDNFKKFESGVSSDVLSVGPVPLYQKIDS